MTFEPRQAGPVGLLMVTAVALCSKLSTTRCAGPSDAAVRILLRSMADLALLTAWLRLNPDVHSELWEGELARQQIELMDALQAQRIDRPSLAPIDPEVAAMPEHRQVADAARKRGLTEGVPGVSRDERRSIMPNIAERTKQIGTPARLGGVQRSRRLAGRVDTLARAHSICGPRMPE